MIRSQNWCVMFSHGVTLRLKILFYRKYAELLRAYTYTQNVLYIHPQWFWLCNVNLKFTLMSCIWLVTFVSKTKWQRKNLFLFTNQLFLYTLCISPPFLWFDYLQNRLYEYNIHIYFKIFLISFKNINVLFPPWYSNYLLCDKNM